MQNIHKYRGIMLAILANNYHRRYLLTGSKGLTGNQKSVEICELEKKNLSFPAQRLVQMMWQSTHFEWSKHCRTCGTWFLEELTPAGLVSFPPQMLPTQGSPSSCSCEASGKFLSPWVLHIQWSCVSILWKVLSRNLAPAGIIYLTLHCHLSGSFQASSFWTQTWKTWVLVLCVLRQVPLSLWILLL